MASPSIGHSADKDIGSIDGTPPHALWNGLAEPHLPGTRPNPPKSHPLYKAAVEEYGEPPDVVVESDNPLDGKFAGPMPVKDFMDVNGFLEGFDRWTRRQDVNASDRRLEIEWAELGGQQDSAPRHSNIFAELPVLSPPLVAAPEDLIVDELWDEVEANGQILYNGLQAMVEALTEEQILPSFDILNTSRVAASHVQHTVNYEYETLGETGAEEVIKLQQNYDVQLLPDISTIPRGCAKPTTVAEHHALQELLFINTVVDPFFPGLFNGFSLSSSTHAIHLGGMGDEDDPIDVDDWEENAYIRESYVQRDRITVVINEFLTAHSHRISDDATPFVPLKGLRTHVYVVLLFDPYVRFIRVDWGGAIVSERTNFRRLGMGVSPFEAFLRGFNEMTPGERGWDTTVSMVDHRSDEAHEAKAAILKHMGPISSPPRGEGSTTRGEHPVLSFRVPTLTPRAEEAVVYACYPLHAWEPSASLASVAQSAEESMSLGELQRRSQYAPLYRWGELCLPSQNALVFPVYDPVRRRVFLLKDTWREEESEYCISESDALHELNLAGIRNIPTLIYGQDVVNLVHPGGERDWGHKFSSQIEPGIRYVAWNKLVRDWRVGGSYWYEPGYKKRIHHRLVEDSMGLAFDGPDGVDDPRSLCLVAYDTLLALSDAYTKVGCIHRNLSPSAIRMVGAEKSVLKGWDRSRPAVYELSPHESASGEIHWQSSRVGQNSLDRRNTIQDDMETLIYIILHHFLKHIATLPSQESGMLAAAQTATATASATLTRHELDVWLGDFFDLSGPECFGWALKYQFCLDDPEWNRENQQVLGLLDQCPPLKDWILDARKMLREWYIARDVYEARAASTGTPKNDWKSRSLKLKDHKAMLKSLQRALEREDWAETLQSQPTESTEVETQDDQGEGEGTTNQSIKDESLEEKWDASLWEDPIWSEVLQVTPPRSFLEGPKPSIQDDSHVPSLAEYLARQDSQHHRHPSMAESDVSSATAADSDDDALSRRLLSFRTPIRNAKGKAKAKRRTPAPSLAAGKFGAPRSSPRSPPIRRLSRTLVAPPPRTEIANGGGGEGSSKKRAHYEDEDGSCDEGDNGILDKPNRVYKRMKPLN